MMDRKWVRLGASVLAIGTLSCVAPPSLTRASRR